MDEELPVPFTLAFLNGYTGSIEPQVDVYQINNFYLGLTLLQQDMRWAINLTIKQDYENEFNRKHRLTMSADSLEVFVDIEIKNIFDNSPTLVALENPCFVDVSQSIVY